jgi:hypothetical protein
MGYKFRNSHDPLRFNNLVEPLTELTEYMKDKIQK